ncbi:carboxymuconolactone decarboxylase family protein [Gallaecimonas pentaromativorans]|uniref:AhpD family alkylhydroperoxidase n=1 Tax=Gallaecimonas pentaromativorans TaxID=584787 RepID=A0A3N1PGC8_9GAMM|nr:carboxymuconolactone decarboxylase family protein [Gallaecimonas pentaromativorans]ROQ27645.1 AhpD family alkylhydroperoxidase [Gallaecimonas pentaromativorans]
MTDFTVYTLDNAPEQSKALLQKSISAFGRLPSLHAVMAEAPGLLEGYQQLHQLFLNSSFDNDEKTVVWQTINVENNCHYCVPAHTAIAKAMGVSDEISNALRDETPLPTAKLEALRTFALAMMRQRGFVEDEKVQAFLDAGFTQRQVLEVVLGLAQKVMSNYTNHLAKTPMDSAFSKYEWHKKGA